ncbi:hypothetical protein CDL15_Pgr026943 [Punica granatum]|uniref:F-box associated beta-propeller type 3 domain-containing protein n=1 Tax=Punica granatum TaxID=22663 RepID=A0A218XYY1_PUNGR|nr:hypothetical protein CDL15_Pgr026943 [Punica granatum]
MGIGHDVFVETFEPYTCSWRKEITSNKFQALHLERLLSIPRHGVIAKTVLRKRRPRAYSVKDYRTSYLNFELNSEHERIHSHSMQLEGLVRYLTHRCHGMQQSDDMEIHVNDSCDGIILAEVLGYYSSENVIMLLVCNPITRCYKLLPFWNSPVRYHTRWRIVRSTSVGRYKIVGLFESLYSIDCHIHDFVLDKQKGSWASWKKLCSPRTASCYFIGASLYANGKLYWLTKPHDSVERNSESCMLSLDIATEKLNVTTRFPEPYPTTHWWYRSQLTSNGMFYQMYYTYDVSPDRPDKMEVWVLKDLDNPVWIRHRVISLPAHGNFVHATDSQSAATLATDTKLIAILDGDNYLVFTMDSGARMFMCDMRSSEWKEIAMDFREFAVVHATNDVHHVGSLISWTK